MRRILLAAFAAATVSSGAISGNAAQAMTLATQAAPAAASLVHRATVVCGANGCAPVQTQRIKRRPPTHP